MSEGLGRFSADCTALHIAKRNCPPNELGSVFRKDGFSICFLILTSYFQGGVPATKYKNNFRLCRSTQQHQPRMLDNAGSVGLVFNYSTPRCVFMTHVSSAMSQCDSNVDFRGVHSKRIAASSIILMGVLSWCTNILYFVQICFQLLIPLLFSSQLPADLRSRATDIVFLWLKFVATDVSCFYAHQIIHKVQESKRGADDSWMLETGCATSQICNLPMRLLPLLIF